MLPSSFLASRQGHHTLCNVIKGFKAIALGHVFHEKQESLIFVTQDDLSLERIRYDLSFFHPDIKVITVPAWDTLPYDRVSPRNDIVGRRLHALITACAEKIPYILLTTAASFTQKLIPHTFLTKYKRSFRLGDRLNLEELSRYLVSIGFMRTGTVREMGEFSIRGGIIDIYPAGEKLPLRLDLMGDQIESIKHFDPMSQRTLTSLKDFMLWPSSELILNHETITAFKSDYRKLFGMVATQSELYDDISNGIRPLGIEHWLPLFYTKLDTFMDYVGTSNLVFDHGVNDALAMREKEITDYYTSRLEFMSAAKSGSAQSTYYPIKPDLHYMLKEELTASTASAWQVFFDTYTTEESATTSPIAAQAGRDFLSARQDPLGNVIEDVTTWIHENRAQGKKVVLLAQSEGSRERLHKLLEDAFPQCTYAASWDEIVRGDASKIWMGVHAIETGFITDTLCVITEADLFGDKLKRRRQSQRKPEEFISEASSLKPGDMVVHRDHGIGRFLGLETLKYGVTSHDCVQLEYNGGDKLYVPVENLNVLSRYGNDGAEVRLDKLGGGAWEARKERVKKNLLVIAEKLIAIAAERELTKGPAIHFDPKHYEEFCARFPFEETEDQLRVIEETLQDLAAERPMDRLVCGDVGFGKTEVALRAAFAVASAGLQVAVVTPTTLLCRQHYRNFTERFKGFPLRLCQLSRLVPARQIQEHKDGLQRGTIDIAIGTHAVLGQSVDFKRLGLVIVDEEQHFGVKQKERLKHLKSNVHVLTLTATPIPRTLQLAMSGVKQMSILATPPVDRLAVRTFISPFDGLVVREAILREKHRGGKTFYVCPRLEDLPKAEDTLKKLAPDLKVAIAHGQLKPSDLEDVMTEFSDGDYDILLSTNIIESGLDIPTANTMIIHRADLFGLAQLYQLRGRVGRGKIRAYCYMTHYPGKQLTEDARKRFDVMHTLDHLGAGFTLASHDLDIRGAGNIVGEEQSGHIREIGVELYQTMMREAMDALRHKQDVVQEGWSPVINIGTSVLIPDTYIPEMDVRMHLYRRLSNLQTHDEVEDMKVELIDRFGPLPEEVLNLTEIIKLKHLCLKACVDKIDAGDKGATISFYKSTYPQPERLVSYLSTQSGTIRLRPDGKMIVHRNWDNLDQRISGLSDVLGQLRTT